MKKLLLSLAFVLGSSCANAADTAVSNETAATTPLAGTELTYCVQGGADRKCTVQSISNQTSVATACPASAAATGAITLTGVVLPSGSSSATYTPASTNNYDCGLVITFSVSVTITLPQAGAGGFTQNGWHVRYVCLLGCTINTTTTTFSPGGGTTLTVPSGDAVDIETDDTFYYNQVMAPTGSVTTQYFTTSANPTYTPNANLAYAIVECVGQGGGGGGAAASSTGVSSGGGGGAGSYSRVRLTKAQIGASQAVTNTAAANGGATGNNPGTAGNDTSLGSLCIGKGGSPGGGAATTSDGAAGAGGVAGTGDLALAGGAGFRGEGNTALTAPQASGQGANGPWGGGGIAVQGSANAVNGTAGTACGGGGSGGQSNGSASTAAGAAGGNGCVIVTEYNYK